MTAATTTNLVLEVEGLSWPLKDGDVIGRLGTVGGEALRKFDVLSRQHLKVEHKGRWQITLLPKAGNETVCNGTAMTPGTPVPIAGLCEIQVVSLTLRLLLEEPAVAAQPEHPVALVTLDKQLLVAWRNRAAMQLLKHDLAPGTEFVRLLETGATLRLRYALMGLRDGAELEECEVASHHEDGTRIALRAVRAGNDLLLALRNVTHERQERVAVEHAAARLDAKIGVLAALLTAKSFVEGDLAAALPLLVQNAADLLEGTSVSAWLPSPAASRAGGASIPLSCRAVAGGKKMPVGKEAVLAKKVVKGEVSPAALAALRTAGLLDEATGTAWLEPVEEHGLLVFQRRDAAQAWLEPDVRLMDLAVALGRQLFGNAQRHEATEMLQSREAALNAELTEAAEYAERLLPAIIKKGPVEVDWIYQPCGRLGGDSFGYEWLDDNRFTLYIGDVMGHGIRSSLHAISVSQTLKLLLARGLGDDPAAWLRALNVEFPMKDHEGLLWTMWCGLYDRRTRTLRHASGGHPPALLCHGDKIEELSCAGPVLGAMEEATYRSAAVIIPEGAKLFLFTDGVYEFPVANGNTGTLADFAQGVGTAAGMKQGECAFLKTRAAGLCAEPQFTDDFTIVRARFGK